MTPHSHRFTRSLRTLAIGGALVLLVALPVGAADVVLKNDGWAPDETSACIEGLAQEEAIAAGLQAPPELKAFQLKSVQVAVCSGSNDYALEIYSDALDGTAAPDELLWPLSGGSEFELTGTAKGLVLRTIDLRSENILIEGGFRLALRQLGTADAGRLARDADGGIHAQRNMLHLEGQWHFAENEGIPGDFIIRARYVTGSCGGLDGTHLGTGAAERPFEGTGAADVFVTRGGKDGVFALGGKDRACGGSGNDDLSGGAAADRLWGEDGKDEIAGEGGTDVLRGGAGDDELNGGGGDDTCIGGGGNDTFSGCETKKQ